MAPAEAPDSILWWHHGAPATLSGVRVNEKLNPNLKENHRIHPTFQKANATI